MVLALVELGLAGEALHTDPQREAADGVVVDRHPSYAVKTMQRDVATVKPQQYIFESRAVF